MTGRSLILALALGLGAGCATGRPAAGPPDQAFDWARDSFAFANETVWLYQDGTRVTGPVPADQETDHYTRRCFTMAAAVVQFWKFARFEPPAPPLAPAELAARIRRVRDTAAWSPARPAAQRVVFPGYRDLRDLSRHEGAALRANLGPGWTTYFHVRKYAMPFVPSPTHQARTNAQIQDWLAHGQPLIVWLYNFPRVNINHCITVFAAAAADRPGQTAYRVYDPNDAEQARTLVYDAQRQEFSYEKTFYFGGGPVHVRPMYLGLLQ